jgi:hypothetical protein
MRIVDKLARIVLTPKQFGAYEYRRYPALGRAWGGPMNGQSGRCKLVADLIMRCDFAALIETGTYRGTTTEWLSAFQLPIYTCEASEENYGFSQARLGGISNIHMLLQDSRVALQSIFKGPLSNSTNRPVLAYLDAHWNDNLPLEEELDIIFSSYPEALVLVDDFEVPDDPGYSFDDYGPGKCLNAGYIAAVGSKHDLVTLYPSTASEHETGARRGCVVIAQQTSAVLLKARNSAWLRSLE